MEIEKSAVSLCWYNNKDKSFQQFTSGFIIKKDNDGILILSVSEVIPKLSKDGLETPILKADMGVTVSFFDHKTEMDGTVLHYDLAINLAVIFIKHCNEFNNHPLPCIQAASMSTEPPYDGQSVKSFHHPLFFDDHGKPQGPFGQFTVGFVADGSYDDKLVHFSLPLIFRGSLGAPVFDNYSNKVVSLITGWESGQRDVLDKAFEVPLWSDVQNRYLGWPVPRIQEFLNNIEDAMFVDPPI